MAHSERMGAADPSSHHRHASTTNAAALLLPASRVLEVVQAQGHQVAAVAEKLARLHARAEALRLRVRERAAAREVVDPFKQVSQLRGGGSNIVCLVCLVRLLVWYVCLFGIFVYAVMFVCLMR